MCRDVLPEKFSQLQSAPGGSAVLEHGHSSRALVVSGGARGNLLNAYVLTPFLGTGSYTNWFREIFDVIYIMCMCAFVIVKGFKKYSLLLVNPFNSALVRFSSLKSL